MRTIFTPKKTNRLKIGFIAMLVGAISSLHYFTQYGQMYHHIVYRELFFLPLIVGAFWYGLRGGLLTSLSITVLYLPFVMLSWNNFSPNDLDRTIEIAFFLIVAIILGILRDREKVRAREKIEGIKAMAGAIAHELNTPLQVVLGNSQLLQEEFDSTTETHQELQIMIDNLRMMKQTIKKISLVDRVELKDYSGGSKIVDIEKAGSPGDESTREEA